MANNLLVFNRYDELLCTLSNKGNESLNFWDAPYESNLKGVRLFEFKCLANHQFSEHVVELNQIGFFDREGKFRLFKIETVEYISDVDGDYIQVYCQASILELLGKIIEDRRPQNQDMAFMLDIALENTRYKVGNMAPLGQKTTSFFFLNAIEVINQIANLFGAEVEERIEINNSRIVGRYIDLPSRLGTDTGKVLRLTKDIINMSQMTSTAHMATALYGRGGSLAIYDEDGEATGGYSRRLDFADVEWSIANGDPMNKPLGQIYLEDPQATEMFGPPEDGTFLPIFALSEHQITDPHQLLQATYEDLMQRTQKFYNFNINIFALGDLIGYEAHKIRLGDTVRVVNEQFTRPIQAESRIITYRYDVANPEPVADVELGHFINLYGASDRLDRLETEIGIIGSRPLPPIDDSVISPPIAPIAGFKANGLFRTVNIDWENQRLGIVFELHASQSQGFTPSVFNMIYRGPDNGFRHATGTDQQWYYRVRATNNQGHSSAWSQEVVANTARITGDFIEHLTIGDAHIENVAADKIRFGILQGIEIRAVEIIGSIFQTTGAISTIDMRQGQMDVIVDNNTITRINQLGVVMHRNDGERSGALSRLGATGQTGLTVSAENGFISTLSARLGNTIASGLLTSSVSVDGTTGATTIWNGVLGNSLSVNGFNLNGGGNLNGNWAVPGASRLGTRHISTAGFTDQRHLGLINFAWRSSIQSVGDTSNGVAINFGENRGMTASNSGGIMMNNGGDVGIMFRGRVSWFDLIHDSWAAGQGVIELGRIRIEWRQQPFPTWAGTIDASITFSRGGFSSSPIVVPIQSNQPNPHLSFVSTSNVTTTGFQLNLNTIQALTVNVRWIAVGRASSW